MELYSANDDGTQRTVFVEVGIDGDVQLGMQDLGVAPLAAFRQHEYEFAVSVGAISELVALLLVDRGGTATVDRSAPESELVMQLLAERYRGDRDAVDHFRGWLKEHNIEHSFWNRMGD